MPPTRTAAPALVAVTLSGVAVPAACGAAALAEADPTGRTVPGELLPRWRRPVKSVPTSSFCFGDIIDYCLLGRGTGSNDHFVLRQVPPERSEAYAVERCSIRCPAAWRFGCNARAP